MLTIEKRRFLNFSGQLELKYPLSWKIYASSSHVHSSYYLTVFSTVTTLDYGKSFFILKAIFLDLLSRMFLFPVWPCGTANCSVLTVSLVLAIVLTSFLWLFLLLFSFSLQYYSLHWVEFVINLSLSEPMSINSSKSCCAKPSNVVNSI